MLNRLRIWWNLFLFGRCLHPVNSDEPWHVSMTVETRPGYFVVRCRGCGRFLGDAT